MKRATLQTESTDEAKEILRESHDATRSYTDITLDLVVDALRQLGRSGDVHEFYGKALEVAEEHDSVTRVLNVEFGAEPRTGRRAHVDVYHVVDGGAIYQMGHVSYGPESEEQGWSDYPDDIAVEDIGRVQDVYLDDMRDKPLMQIHDVKCNVLGLDVPEHEELEV